MGQVSTGGWVSFAAAATLFLGADTGGERAAIIYTVAETAKLNGLDPEAYIAAVIGRLCRGHTIDRIDELLPWNFKPETPTVATG